MAPMPFIFGKTVSVIVRLVAKSAIMGGNLTFLFTPHLDLAYNHRLDL